ncbi:hypothetical protein M9Y10_001009 [Tritrichomonas musculus]|uniref:Uncharacterized protein n=1 Tax=Tritrichomonas musculus TaxID=1915356 RepID=A0ABR2L5U6_9EUKA
MNLLKDSKIDYLPKIINPITKPPKEVTPEEITPKEATPEEVPPKEATPEEVPPKEATPEEVPPKEATPEEVPPKEATPEEVPPKEATPEEVPPKEATPEEVPPKEATPEEITPKEATPEEVPPKEATPEEVPPKEATPEEIEKEQNEKKRAVYIEAYQKEAMKAIQDRAKSKYRSEIYKAKMTDKQLQLKCEEKEKEINDSKERELTEIQETFAQLLQEINNSGLIPPVSIDLDNETQIEQLQQRLTDQKASFLAEAERQQESLTQKETESHDLNQKLGEREAELNEIKGKINILNEIKSKVDEKNKKAEDIKRDEDLINETQRLHYETIIDMSVFIVSLRQSRMMTSHRLLSSPYDQDQLINDIEYYKNGVETVINNIITVMKDTINGI